MHDVPPHLDVPVAPAAGPSTTSPRRLLAPALVVGIGLVIDGLGLLGPKPERAPSAVLGSAPLAASAPAAPAPSAAGAAGSPLLPGPAVVLPATSAPVLRIPAGPLADPWILHGGRRVDLSLGTDPGVDTGCELEPAFVLAGGRIGCVAQVVARSPGSRRATYDLSMVTLGYGRTRPSDPSPIGPPAAALRGAPSARVAQPRVAVEVLDASSGSERIYAGQLSPIACDPTQALVIR